MKNTCVKNAVMETFVTNIHVVRNLLIYIIGSILIKMFYNMFLTMFEVLKRSFCLIFRSKTYHFLIFFDF
jgi:hypothetical protein